MCESDIVDKYSQAKYLFLDDIGTEKITAKTIEILFLILDKRINENKRKVFITSNHSLSELARLIDIKIGKEMGIALDKIITGEKITSRIANLCDIIKMTGTQRLTISGKGGSNCL